MNSQITPEFLKIWMTTNGINRMQLADKLMVSKSTIDGWCSTRPIGLSKRKALRLLMMEMEHQQKNHTDLDDLNKMGVQLNESHFTKQEWQRICLAAKIQRTSPELFLKMTVLGLLAKIDKTLKRKKE